MFWFRIDRAFVFSCPVGRVYISTAVSVVNSVGQMYSTPEHQGRISTFYINATAGLEEGLCLEFHTPKFVFE